MALKKWFPIFVLPTLAAFTIVFAVPFILGLGLSFTEFTTVLDAKWVAFANYIKAFSNRDFLNALWFTVKFTVVSVITINVISFGLAALLTKGYKGTNIFRTVFLFMSNISDSLCILIQSFSAVFDIFVQEDILHISQHNL